MSRVVHFEIPTEDPQRAIDFYTKVFGWTFQKFDGPFDYWLITTGEENTPGINGGLTRREGPMPADDAPLNAYACVIDVASIDETLAAVTKAGCKIVLDKGPVPGLGWIFYFKDTEGNLVSAMESDPNAA